MAPPCRADRGDRVTPLNAPLHEVLMAIKNTPHLIMRRPQNLPSFHTGHRDKFYEFRPDFRHDTKSCRELWDFVEDLIRRGYVKQFKAHEERDLLEPVLDKRKREKSVETRGNTKEHKRSVPSPRRDLKTANRVTEEILVISGGPMDGDRTNARKRV